MRRLAMTALLLSFASPAAGQNLASDFRQMFTFGDCGQPLCLVVNEAVHGMHFIPSVTQGQHDMLSFMTGSIATSLGNLPFTSATSGVTFSFVGGTPVATSVSGGPIFAERAQTLGRGRMLAGVNFNGLSMDNVRGIPLNNLSFTFTHQNVADAALGDPVYENDLIDVHTHMKLNLLATSVFASYGVLDNLDVGILVPIIHASLSGSSLARIVDAEANSPHHFGTQANPVDTAFSASSGSATGIGDIAVRAKLNLRQTTTHGYAILADIRVPTGDTANFLGSGALSVRVLGVASARYGNFSPHVNAGFALRAGNIQNNSLLATIGFDQLVSPKVTIAGEVIGDFMMGQSKLELPKPVVFTSPTVRTVKLTDIPDRKDNIIDASLGLKFTLPNQYRLVTNFLLPLAKAGLQPKFLWTVGFERTF